jgi:hypothetical protein
MLDILAATLKRPYCLGASFIVSYERYRCVPSNQTLSPSLDGLYFISLVI